MTAAAPPVFTGNPLSNQSLDDSPIGRKGVAMCVSCGVGMVSLEGWRCGFPMVWCGGVAGPPRRKTHQVDDKEG